VLRAVDPETHLERAACSHGGGGELGAQLLEAAALVMAVPHRVLEGVPPAVLT
jgi:hypothetical protein